jgi:hypothetical protein
MVSNDHVPFGTQKPCDHMSRAKERVIFGLGSDIQRDRVIDSMTRSFLKIPSVLLKRFLTHELVGLDVCHLRGIGRLSKRTYDGTVTKQISDRLDTDGLCTKPFFLLSLVFSSIGGDTPSSTAFQPLLLSSTS